MVFENDIFTQKFGDYPEFEVSKVFDNSKHYDMYMNVIKEFVKNEIGYFLTDQEIDKKLSKIKKIDIDSKLFYIGNTSFEDGLLRLPLFFNQKIEREEELKNLLNNYPNLKDLLTTYGIYVLLENKDDSEKTKILKNLFATHYATGPRKVEVIDFDGLKFNVRATTNAITEYVLGEYIDTFYDTLTDKEVFKAVLNEGNFGFENLINERTNSKELGPLFVGELLKLESYIRLERDAMDIVSYANLLLQTELKQYGSNGKASRNIMKLITEMAERGDYDFPVLNSPDSDEPLDLSGLTESQKELIDKYTRQYNIKWWDNELSSMNIIVSNNGEGRIKFSNGKDYWRVIFDFIDKFIKMKHYMLGLSEYLIDEIDKIYTEINVLLTTQIIPAYEKKEGYAKLDSYRLVEYGSYNSYTRSKTKKLIRNHFTTHK